LTSPSADTDLVTLRDVNFGYSRRPVLRGVDLSVPKGKVVAIMGGSGSGKTTILRLIGGQLRAQTGEVRVAGADIAQLDSNGLFRMRRLMGMLFQFGALFTDISVYDNVAFPLREHTSLPDEIINDLVIMKLEAVGLRGAARMRPAELSGGMARRVALARTIALDPMLIMYDEPFAGLDPISLAVIGDLIRRLNDALGATSIIVTHDVFESLKIVDHIYFVADGRIVAQGAPGELRGSSVPFVHQFLNGVTDGPVPFHYPAASFQSELMEARDG